MTAVLAVRKERSIEMLTDSAVICGGTGKVLGFMPKQFAAAIPQCMIGATGDTRTVFEFGRRLHLRGIGTFDQLVEHAAELWRESLDAAHSERWRDLVGFQALALAGWSKRREQLELYSLTSDESGLSETSPSWRPAPRRTPTQCWQVSSRLWKPIWRHSRRRMVHRPNFASV